MKTETIDFNTLDRYIHCYYVLTSGNFSVRLISMYKPIKESTNYFQIGYSTYLTNQDGTIRHQEYTNQLSETEVINIINYINRSYVVAGRLSNVKQGQVFTRNDNVFAIIDSFDVALIPNIEEEQEKKLELN